VRSLDPPRQLSPEAHAGGGESGASAESWAGRTQVSLPGCIAV